MFTSRFGIGCHRHHTSARLARQALLAAICALLLPLSAGAQPTQTPGLTLERALLMSQQHSRQMAAQEAVAQSARQMAIVAGQPPDLTLKLGINNLPVTGRDQFNLTNDFMTMTSIGVMKELTGSAKLKARAARFEREAEVADANRAMAQINLQRDTATAWLDRHFLERMRELLQAQRDEGKLQIEAAEAAYRGGRGTQAEVFAVRSAVALMDDRLKQSQQQVLMAQTRLVRWVGPEGARMLAAPPDLSTVGSHLEKVDDLETLLKNHPHVAVLDRQEAVARAEANVAQTEKKADWSMELMFNQRGPAYSNMVSINFSVPLQGNQAQRQDRELAAKLALVDQMQAQREEAIREHVAETRAWLQQWQGNRQRLMAYDNSLIPLSRQRTQAALAAYRGNGPLLAVLEARRIEIETQMDRLRLEMETAGLWAQLNHLVADGHDVANMQTPATAQGK